MKQWFKKNLTRIVISSAITLLPMLYGVLFWDKLPASLTTHWGADGVADGNGSKAFVVFGIPAIFLAVNLLCVFCTYLDKNNREKNQKAMGLIFWFMPIISVAINCAIYKTSSGSKADFFWLFPVLIGSLFIAMGNYMPKVTQNRTFGIKIFWTLVNEENWNKTHRFSGKIWVAGGVLVLTTAFLPIMWSIGVLLITILLMVVIPYTYSYNIYRNHKAQGIEYVAAPKTKTEKNAVIFSSIFVPLILIGVAVLMFTGNIQYEFKENSLEIRATYGEDSSVKYDAIDAIEYREDYDCGIRNVGFASVKLSLGSFKNDEFGNYTLYAYTTSDSAVVIKSGEHILVITGEDTDETLSLFNTLQMKIK